MKNRTMLTVILIAFFSGALVFALPSESSSQIQHLLFSEGVNAPQLEASTAPNLINLQIVPADNIALAQSYYFIAFNLHLTTPIRTIEITYPSGFVLTNATVLEQVVPGVMAFSISGQKLIFTLPIEMAVGDYPFSFLIGEIGNGKSLKNQVSVIAKDQLGNIILGPTLSPVFTLIHITSYMINSNAVTTATIANNAVTNVKIADGAVTNSKIANNSINSTQMQNGAITQSKFSSDVITNECPANDSVLLDLENQYLLFINWKGCNLSKANFSGSNLKGANFQGANLGGANLGFTDLYYAKLNNANLTGDYLRGTTLSNADLSGANLANTNLSITLLSNANLTGANIAGADFSGAHGTCIGASICATLPNP